MIEKKIYYIWIGNAKKPDIFYKCYNSWKKNLPEFEIIEINEKNFDMEKHLEKNSFFRECHRRRLWAYMSDYMRVHFMYENSGVYVDTDMEIINDISPLMEDNEREFFIGYEDERHVSAGIFGCKKNSCVLGDMIKFYEKDIWNEPLWTIPKIFTYIFEKNYGLTKKRENKLENGKIMIYPKEYFYPYGHKENYSPECIRENTYGIHWWNESWGNLRTRLFVESKHLRGIGKLIKQMRITARYYLKEKR